MKLKYCKRLKVMVTLWIIVVTVIWGCGKKGDESEQSAVNVLEQVFGCSLQDAEDLDAVFVEMKEEAEAGSEPGISQAGEGLEDYFRNEFGNSMTEECLEKIMANRTCVLSRVLAKQVSSDIAVEEIEMKKRSGEQVIFDFSAKLIKAADGTQISEINGNITMIYDETEWKASNLDATVKN